MITANQMGISDSITRRGQLFRIELTLKQVILNEPTTNGYREISYLLLESTEAFIINNREESLFRKLLSNNSLDPRLSLNRIKFFLCYTTIDPIDIDENNELYTPIISEHTLDNLIGESLPFVARISEHESRGEILELDYTPITINP